MDRGLRNVETASRHVCQLASFHNIEGGGGYLGSGEFFARKIYESLSPDEFENIPPFDRPTSGLPLSGNIFSFSFRVSSSSHQREQNKSSIRPNTPFLLHVFFLATQLSDDQAVRVNNDANNKRRAGRLYSQPFCSVARRVFSLNVQRSN